MLMSTRSGCQHGRASAAAGGERNDQRMRVTGTLQQEAWARNDMPPAERVVPGVWSVPVPIPDNPLRYVLSYLIEHAAGFVLVDPGWNAPASWRALTGGLDA